MYNTDSDLVRVVALMPTLSWGGRGLLGAEVGTGYLHRLPAAACRTSGASVERKVRYVGGSTDTHPTGNSSAGSGGQRQVPNLSKNRPASTAVLELEPQLEMEADPDGDEESDASSKPPDEVAAPKSENNREPKVPETSALPTRDLKPPPSSVPEKDLKPPPPAGTSSEPSSTFLPPPPKMHYDTPPKAVS